MTSTAHDPITQTTTGAAPAPTERGLRERYDPTEIEPRWQARWEELGLHRTDLEDTSRPKFYLLTMYPYPSGDLHIGHWYIKTPTDAIARYHRMHGENVFFPIGFDAFGLPAENAAIKSGTHPYTWTMKNIEHMRRQLRSMGNTFAWDAEIVTADPKFYRWNQWIFLKLLEAGLAYRKMAAVDWCPRDQVTLAREQVEGPDRVCWRCGTPVIKRDLEQWFLRTTAYAEELLSFDGIDWPEPVRVMQANWIGRSEGAEIVFSAAPGEDRPGGEEIRVFTTRPDTLFGATFMVLAPEHPLVDRLTARERREAVGNYRFEASRKSEIDRLSTDRQKSGVPIGADAINPVNGERIPIWIADYVLATYGTGAIMAVPAHDERDYEFARWASLPIRRVIEPRDRERAVLAAGQVGGVGIAGSAYLAKGDDHRLVNSGSFDGLSPVAAIRAITASLEERGKGKLAVSYRLRDWLFSRQRYWGTPIPVVYCERDGIVPVPEAELPVELPMDAEFQPTGESPLKSHAGFLNTTCPRCHGPARRETDTMDTFIDSSWYWWRYLSPDDRERAIDRRMEERWCPVDQYTGGAEHAVMHLLYARFFAKALADLGLVHEREPFRKLYNQGQILGADGERMSKSRGNVQDPDELVQRFGADTVRLFLMFMGPWDQGGPWSEQGIGGVHRFLNRVWTVTLDPHGQERSTAVAATLDAVAPAESARGLRAAAHRTLQAVTADHDGFRWNTMIAHLMELTNELMRHRGSPVAKMPEWDEAVRLLLLMLAPLAPHISEELWSRRLAAAGEGWRSIHEERWPTHDESIVVAETIELPVQVNGKLRDLVPLTPGLSEVEIEQLVLARDKVRAALAGRQPSRIVHVPGRAVNLVVR